MRAMLLLGYWLLAVVSVFGAEKSTAVFAAEARQREDFPRAEQLYRQALEAQPDDTGLQLVLAAVLSFQQRTAEALRLYDRVVLVDSGNVAALSGRARMLWWRNRPHAALKAYCRVLVAEPQHAEALRNSARIRNVLRVRGGAIMKNIGEWEEDAAYTGSVRPFQEYRLGYRVHDALYLQAGAYLDHSEKRYYNDEEGIDTLLQTERFNQYYVRTGWYLPFGQQLMVHGVYGFNPEDWTAYGAVWHGKNVFGSLALEWAMEGGYECFYHWTAAARDFAGASLALRYGSWFLDARGRWGWIRENDILRFSDNDTLQLRDVNEFTTFRSTLEYAPGILKGIKLRGVHEFYSYRDGAPGYYAPRYRSVYSTGAAYGWQLGWFVYELDAATGYDDGGELLNGDRAPDGIYTSAALKCGVHLYGVTVGAGMSFFTNPRYRSQVFQVYLER